MKLPDDKEELARFRLQDLFDLRYATKDEVRLVRGIVFGAVGLILSTVVLAGLAAFVHLHV